MLGSIESQLKTTLSMLESNKEKYSLISSPHKVYDAINQLTYRNKKLMLKLYSRELDKLDILRIKPTMYLKLHKLSESILDDVLQINYIITKDSISYTLNSGRTVILDLELSKFDDDELFSTEILIQQETNIKMIHMKYLKWLQTILGNSVIHYGLYGTFDNEEVANTLYKSIEICYDKNENNNENNN